MASQSQPVSEAVGEALRPGKRPLWRLPLCALKLCGHHAKSNAAGCWGECDTCHQRVGFVSRAELRAYIDQQEAAIAALHREWDAEIGRPDGILRAETAFERRALQRYITPGKPA